MNCRLFSKVDHYVTESLLTRQNSPACLMKMSFVPAIFLATCPTVLSIAPLLFEFFWPKTQGKPDVNEGLAAILAVIGLTCAVIYGYAFDIAIKSGPHAKKILSKRLAVQRSLLMGVERASFFNFWQKAGIIRLVKEETTSWMTIIVQWKQGEKWTYASEFRKDFELFLIESDFFDTDEQLRREQISDLIDKADTITECNGENTVATLKPRITVLIWFVLILLGIVSCTVMMFTTMSSYKVDLMFSLITVEVIFMFLYFLADMDDPIHGFVGLDLKGLSVLLDDMEKCFLRVQDVQTTSL